MLKLSGFAGAESHAGQVFVCVAALAIADSLHLLDRDLLSWWCAPVRTAAALLARSGKADMLHAA